MSDDFRTDRITPGIDQLTDLTPSRQLVFLEDMAVLGRAVSEVCRRRDPEFRRIDLEIQGNTDAFLHAHVTPRYEWEPDDIVGWPAFGPQHDDLRAELAAEIDRQQALRLG